LLCLESDSSHVYCFEQGSSAAALVQEAKKKQNRRLEKYIAAWMSFRLLQEKKEFPDLLIPAICSDIPYKSELNVSLAKQLAAYSKIPILEVFRFVLDPKVYGEEGAFLGKLAFRKRYEQNTFEGKKIGIVSADGTTPLPYANLLTQARSVVAISFLQPLA